MIVYSFQNALMARTPSELTPNQRDTLNRIYEQERALKRQLDALSASTIEAHRKRRKASK